MFSIRKTKSTPVLNTHPTHCQEQKEQFDKNITFLEKIFNGMIVEYKHMDKPIKIPTKPNRPPSETPTINKILLSLLPMKHFDDPNSNLLTILNLLFL
jgi:hypothetical protein